MSHQSPRPLAHTLLRLECPAMPIPPHVAELRRLVGHRLLWLATARAVTLDDQGQVILGRYAGHRHWTFPGGVFDPAEQPADAAVRECYEESGIIAVPEALTSVSVSGLVKQESADLTQHLELTFRCKAVGGEACPSDGEFQDVRWHRLDVLPELDTYDLDLLRQATTTSEQAGYTFSGLTNVLGLPDRPAS